LIVRIFEKSGKNLEAILEEKVLIFQNSNRKKMKRKQKINDIIIGGGKGEQERKEEEDVSFLERVGRKSERDLNIQSGKIGKAQGKRKQRLKEREI